MGLSTTTAAPSSSPPPPPPPTAKSGSSFAPSAVTSAVSADSTQRGVLTVSDAVNTKTIWALTILMVIIGLYVYHDNISSLEQRFGIKFNSFLQPFRVSRATIFKNYLILLMLYIVQIALNQEIPLMDVPNWSFLVLVLITWVFWFVLSY